MRVLKLSNGVRRSSSWTWRNQESKIYISTSRMTFWSLDTMTLLTIFLSLGNLIKIRLMKKYRKSEKNIFTKQIRLNLVTLIHVKVLTKFWCKTDFAKIIFNIFSENLRNLKRSFLIGWQVFSEIIIVICNQVRVLLNFDSVYASLNV